MKTWISIKRHVMNQLFLIVVVEDAVDDAYRIQILLLMKFLF